MNCRQKLKKNYKEKKLSQMKYLSEIGALSLKSFNTRSDQESKTKPYQQRKACVSTSERRIQNACEITEATIDEIEESRCNEIDSSESENDDDNIAQIETADDNPTDQAVPLDPATVSKKCPVCKSGFRSSPFVKCTVCGSKTHTRCIKKGTDKNSFYCKYCSPSTSSIILPMDCYQTKLDLETGYRKLDERLRNLGFQKSPSQLRTIGDGDCGPRSVLDQLMNGRTKVNFKDDKH